MLYIGVDPGKGGGFAMLSANGRVRKLANMPSTDADVHGLLLGWALDDEALADADGAFAVLERVQAWVGGPMGVGSAFKLGRNFGALQMALAAVRIPFDLVQPQKWQKALGCLSHGNKNITKQRAQALFPGVRITHATADALLMAEYCRRIRSGANGGQEERQAEEGQLGQAVSRRGTPA